MADSPAGWARFVRSLEGRRVHVVGLGSTESSAFADVARHHAGRLVVHDWHPTLDEARASFEDTHVALDRAERRALFERIVAAADALRLGERYLEGLDEADLVWLPQSWEMYAPNAPLRAWVRAHPDRVATLIGVYFDVLACPIAGITGTNGKTTVASLLVAILQAAGVRVVTGGNHRYLRQGLDALAHVQPGDAAVVEVSHRHLGWIRRGPDVAVLTNVQGDHLNDFGGSFEAYAARKARIFAGQPAGGLAVFDADDPVAHDLWRRASSPALPLPVSLRGPVGGPDGAWFEAGRLKVRRGGVVVLDVDAAALRLLGEHARRNALAAMAAATQWGVSDSALVERVLRSFRGVRHRLEYLRRIDGVPVYDDTASTSPAATAAALRALAAEGLRPVVVLGGRNKGNDYTSLGKLLDELALAVVGTQGSAVEAAADCVRRCPVEAVGTLRAALDGALARARQVPGGAVLVSPAGAGFRSAAAREGGLRRMVRTWGRPPAHTSKSS